MVSNRASTPSGGSVLFWTYAATRAGSLYRGAAGPPQPPAIVHAKQKRPAVRVRQAGNSLGQLTIVEVRFELGCQLSPTRIRSLVSMRHRIA